jgi:hypothetical protein
LLWLKTNRLVSRQREPGLLYTIQADSVAIPSDYIPIAHTITTTISPEAPILLRSIVIEGTSISQCEPNVVCQKSPLVEMTEIYPSTTVKTNIKTVTKSTVMSNFCFGPKTFNI